MLMSIMKVVLYVRGTNVFVHNVKNECKKNHFIVIKLASIANKNHAL